jgi:Zn-dependent protease/predicted transcriptional regulator
MITSRIKNPLHNQYNEKSWRMTMRTSILIGKIKGIPIQLHISWFLIAILITWTLAGGYFPRAYPGWEQTAYWLVGALTAVLFFASVLLHELGHSIMALREKVPVKAITLFIFGGVAQISREPDSPGAELRIAIAGPLVSLLLAGGFSLLGRLPGMAITLAAPLAYLGSVNLILAAFNLIPGFPMDGGRVLRAALWKWRRDLRSATLWASRVGQAFASILMLAGVAQILFTGNFFNGLWTLFIGWFLNNAAQNSYQQVLMRVALSGVKASSIMLQQCPTVSGDLLLDRLVNDYILNGGQRCFFVTEQGQVEGLITLQNVRGVPLARRLQSTVHQVMTPLNVGAWTTADEDAFNVLRKMDEANLDQIPVIEDGRVLGLITREALLRYLRLRQELAV